MADELKNDSPELNSALTVNPVVATFQAKQPQEQITAADQPIISNDSVNVINPEGDLVSIPKADLPKALESKQYRLPTDEDYNYAEHGTAGQQAIGTLEQFGRSATLGLSTGAEKALGVSPEAMVGREQALEAPLKFGAELAGIIKGPVGAIGEAVGTGAEALGIGGEGAGILGKIGSNSLKIGAESAAMQGGDEVSKMFLGDNYSDTLGAAISNIAGAGLLGGAIGGFLVGPASYLWEQNVGKKLSPYLQNMRDGAGGVEGKTPDWLNDSLANLGLNEGQNAMPNELKQMLSEDPQIQNMARLLNESKSSASAAEYQTTNRAFQELLVNKIPESMGISPEHLESYISSSEKGIGDTIKDNIVYELNSRLDPMAKVFDDVKNKYQSTELINKTPLKRIKEFYKKWDIVFTPENLPPTEVPNLNDLVEKVSKYVNENNFSASADSKQLKFINKVFKSIEGFKSLRDVSSFVTNDLNPVASDWMNTANQHVASNLRSMFRDFELDSVEKFIQKEGNPGLLSNLKKTRLDYAEFKKDIDILNDRLHVGSFVGGQGFMAKLKEMAPETVLSRLSNPKFTSTFDVLKDKFPNTAQSIRDYLRAGLFKKAVLNAKEPFSIDSNKFFGAYNSLGNDARNFLVRPADQPKLASISKLLDGLRAKNNSSGSAASMAQILKGAMPTGSMTLASLHGGNPISGFIFGQVMKHLTTEVPDAVRLTMLKALGTSSDVSASGLAAGSSFASSVYRGLRDMNKAASSVFTGLSVEAPRMLKPKEEDKKKLQKKIDDFGMDNSKFIDATQKLAYYMPGEANAVAAAAGQMVSYMNSIKPQPFRMSPFDEEMPVPEEKQSAYDRQLSIAAAPLSILNHVKEGTLIPEDIQTLQNIASGLHGLLSKKLIEEMYNAAADKTTIPYKTKQSLALFLGAPVDSSMTPEAILANQPKPQAPMQQQAAKGSSGHSLKNMGKMAQLDATPNQSRIMQKATRS